MSRVVKTSWGAVRLSEDGSVFYRHKNPMRAVRAAESTAQEWDGGQAIVVSKFFGATFATLIFLGGITEESVLWVAAIVLIPLFLIVMGSMGLYALVNSHTLKVKDELRFRSATPDSTHGELAKGLQSKQTYKLADAALNSMVSHGGEFEHEKQRELAVSTLELWRETSELQAPSAADVQVSLMSMAENFPTTGESAALLLRSVTRMREQVRLALAEQKKVQAQVEAPVRESKRKDDEAKAHRERTEALALERAIRARETERNRRAMSQALASDEELKRALSLVELDRASSTYPETD